MLFSILKILSGPTLPTENYKHLCRYISQASLEKQNQKKTDICIYIDIKTDDRYIDRQIEIYYK